MNVRVDLGERSYEVVIGSGARGQLASLIAARAPKAKVAVVVVAEHLRAFPWFDLDPGIEVVELGVPDGESAKQLSVVEALCEQMSIHQISREDVIVGVGGGATTDVAGFVASIYQRGVGVVHVATTLAAQVDAAIGGKTGVDLSVGKNLVGAFHQPLGVLCDLDTLSTLPERQLSAGLGEVAKCWILLGRSAGDALSATLQDRIEVSVGYKAAVVSGDERDTGKRALLNYGHTLAHALEALQLAGGSLDVLHGEAVATGVAFAARLARRLGRVGDEVVAQHDEVLDAFQLNYDLPRGLDHDAVVAAMRRDKKAHHDITFVLASPVGFEVVGGVETSAIYGALSDFESEQS